MDCGGFHANSVAPSASAKGLSDILTVAHLCQELRVPKTFHPTPYRGKMQTVQGRLQRLGRRSKATCSLKIWDSEPTPDSMAAPTLALATPKPQITKPYTPKPLGLNPKLFRPHPSRHRPPFRLRRDRPRALCRLLWPKTQRVHVAIWGILGSKWVYGNPFGP